MKIIRKYVAMLLCMCFSVYSMPVFASQVAVESSEVKIELTDEAMSLAVGANGSVDVNVSDYVVAGSEASASFANRTTLPLVYSLDVTDTNGNVTENLVTGSIASDSAVFAVGTPTVAPSNKIQARIWHAGLPGMESKDTSWAP